jgi:gamma-tubulin complex component 3
LDYRFPPLDEGSPLSAIITPHVLDRYQSIFGFLWRLKRVEYSLSSAWRQHAKNRRAVGDWIPELGSVMHRIHILRNQMTHFTSNLHNYMMFEVLENSWTEFQTECNQAQNLDHIIGSHFQYLDQISRKTLISGLWVCTFVCVCVRVCDPHIVTGVRYCSVVRYRCSLR